MIEVQKLGAQLFAAAVDPVDRRLKRLSVLKELVRLLMVAVRRR